MERLEAPTATLLEVEGLRVSFGAATAVDGVSLSLERRRTLAVVGESGSGKSVMGRAILGLHPRGGYSVAGAVRLDGEELLAAKASRLRRLRGASMAMIFQDPLSALHPYYRVGWQLVESLRASDAHLSRTDAHAEAVEMFRRVGFADAEKRLRAYPHELSGGMRQRAMIAMALIRRPQLLIADEPTTALDVTVQAQILSLIRGLQQEYGTGVILITHDLGVAAEVADDVVVLYGGHVLERGSVDDVLTRPQHPYTWGLLKSLTRLDRRRQRRLEPIAGSPARAGRIPPGCPFHPRCPYAASLGGLCATDRPPLRPVVGRHEIACHLPDVSRREIVATEIAPWVGAAS